MEPSSAQEQKDYELRQVYRNDYPEESGASTRRAAASMGVFSFRMATHAAAPQGLAEACGSRTHHSTREEPNQWL